MDRILVFPGGLSESLEFLRYHVTPQSLIGASSIANDPVMERYADWSFIPDMHDRQFEKVLGELIREKSVVGIFCPHNLVHEKISVLIEQNRLDVALINRCPTDQAYMKIENVRDNAAPLFQLAQDLCGEQGRGVLPDFGKIASWLNYSDSIFGHSSYDKLAALLAALADTPKGDVVEIGSYWGKSASWLAFVAGHYGVGPLLSVDPWDNEAAVQKDSPDFLKDIIRDTMANDAFEGFLMFMGIMPSGSVNYIRLPSDKAFFEFEKSETVCSEAFGETPFSRRISLLHIDGNHDYEVVCSDRDLWTQMVVPGGWIVFDDYVWVHGDGPRRAGDEYLEANRDRISRSFVCGKALFVQLAS
ncbi:class I SAM-dependent methyltransferase [Kiloniella sp. b19]|uniref:class I SAM-dependent methyltransferase n=1 Tax=Kiloniella sp. GXU_MW_B19 TaxID=3141326 RepID=UPI0031D37A26